METIAQQVTRVITEMADLTGYPAPDDAEIKPETHLFNDIGFDSLDAIETVMAIEAEFDIDLPDADIENVVTVQGAIDVVRKHCPQRAATEEAAAK